MVNEFLPLISRNVVTTMREKLNSDGLAPTSGDRKRRRPSPWSGGDEADSERW